MSYQLNQKERKFVLERTKAFQELLSLICTKIDRLKMTKHEVLLLAASIMGIIIVEQSDETKADPAEIAVIDFGVVNTMVLDLIDKMKKDEGTKEKP